MLAEEIMYSPKIKEDLIPKIYQKAKSQGILTIIKTL